MRSVIFPNVIKVRMDADLHAVLARVASAERTTVSEVVRRELRSGFAGRSSRPQNDDGPGPFSGAPGLRAVA